MLFSRYLYSSHGLVAEVVYYQPADLDLIPTDLYKSLVEAEMLQ